MLDSLSNERVLNMLTPQVPPVGHRDVRRRVEYLQVQFRYIRQTLQLDRPAAAFTDDPVALTRLGGHHHRRRIAVE